ncbi:MAG: YybS family protein [Peptococcaceae bacterium]|jgi:hypothetical protein|nr:YybS family protein [Peptococcaceae bacterium]
MARTKDGVLFYLGLLTLLVFPWLGAVLPLLGWVTDVCLLIAVFGLSNRLGWFKPALCLAVGYIVAVGTQGIAGMALVHYTPLAGIFGAWSRRWPSRGTAFFWALAAAALLAVAPFLLSFGVMLQEALAQENIDAMLRMYQANGFFEPFQQQGMSDRMIREVFVDSMTFYLHLTPAFVAILGMLEYGLAHAIFQRILRRMSGTRNMIIPFSLWRFPRWTIWGANLGILLFLGGDVLATPAVKLTGMNLMLIYAGLAFVLGMAVVAFFLRAFRVSGLVKWGIIAFNVIFAPFSVITLTLLGLLDLGLNFRRLPDQPKLNSQD